MKNKAVEAMIRVQFNIPDHQKVNVEFIAIHKGAYEFKATWVESTFDTDTCYEATFKLPRIEPQSTFVVN